MIPCLLGFGDETDSHAGLSQSDASSTTAVRHATQRGSLGHFMSDDGGDAGGFNGGFDDDDGCAQHPINQPGHLRRALRTTQKLGDSLF